MFEIIEGIVYLIEGIVALIAHGNKWVWGFIAIVIIAPTIYALTRPDPEPIPEPETTSIEEVKGKLEETFKALTQ